MNGAGMIKVKLEQGELIVEKGVALPHVCVKCARGEGLVWLEHEFAWSPREVRPTAVLGPIGLFAWLVSLVETRRTAVLSLPLCERCDRRWARTLDAKLAAYLWCVVAVALVVVGFARGPGVLVGVGVVSLLAVPAAVHLFFVQPRTLQARRIEGVRVWLGGVAPEALRAIDAAVQAEAAGTESQDRARG